MIRNLYWAEATKFDLYNGSELARRSRVAAEGPIIFRPEGHDPIKWRNVGHDS
jgi:hypothetical protein